MTELEYGLIVLWELFEFQAPLLEGFEADVFDALLSVRYSGHPTVSHAWLSPPPIICEKAVLIRTRSSGDASDHYVPGQSHVTH